MRSSILKSSVWIDYLVRYKTIQLHNGKMEFQLKKNTFWEVTVLIQMEEQQTQGIKFSDCQT